jgi:hypothetical protein
MLSTFDLSYLDMWPVAAIPLARGGVVSDMTSSRADARPEAKVWGGGLTRRIRSRLVINEERSAA